MHAVSLKMTRHTRTAVSFSDLRLAPGHVVSKWNGKQNRLQHLTAGVLFGFGIQPCEVEFKQGYCAQDAGKL